MASFKASYPGSLILYMLLQLFVMTSYSQDNDKKLKDNFLYGEYYLTNRLYRDALPFFLSIYQRDSLNANINYKIGKCYINIRGEKLNSIPYLETASKNITTKYIENKLETESAPIESLMLLGEAYQRNNELNKALKTYHNYKDYLKPKQKEDQAKINLKIQTIETAKQEMENALDLKIINLGSEINSRFSDYNPLVSVNDSILIFTSFWESADLILSSYKLNGKWTKPLDINQELGSDGDCYTSAISSDAKELYLVKQGNYNSDIYVSHFKDGKWSFIQKLNKKVNSSAHETSISISTDGNTIYFSSNRAGGAGGFDIYKSEKKDGDWCKPVNLGKTINTRYNEEAPFISDDGKMLFFSSEGHRNMGGMDIFYSILNNEGKWNEPVNMGCPINTTNDDIFISLTNNGKTLYLAKYAPEGCGKHDIYKTDLPFEDKVDNKLVKIHADSDSAETVQKDLSIYDSGKYTGSEEQLSSADRVITDTSQLLASNNDEFVNNNLIIYQNSANNQHSGEKIPYYTVQIMALLKPVHPSYFKKLVNIKASKGTDSFHRYTYGKYSGYTLARQYLRQVRKLGYTDAFIREINTISNYYEK